MFNKQAHSYKIVPHRSTHVWWWQKLNIINTLIYLLTKGCMNVNVFSMCQLGNGGIQPTRSHIRIMSFVSFSSNLYLFSHSFVSSHQTSILTHNCHTHFLHQLLALALTQPLLPSHHFIHRCINFCIIYCISCSPVYSPLRLSIPRLHHNLCILLFVLCVWCFPGPRAHLNWCDGVCLCVVDIIPRRVNKGYAPSTRCPRHNKGLAALLSLSVCVRVCLSLNESCYQIRMNKGKTQTNGDWESPFLYILTIKQYTKHIKYNFKSQHRWMGTLHQVKIWCSRIFSHMSLNVRKGN